MSDSNSSQATSGRRPPRVGVYVPRHRRGINANGDSSAGTDPTESQSSSTSSSSRPAGSGNLDVARDNWQDDRSPSRSGYSSSGSEIQRRGRGKFMGPGGGTGSGSAGSAGNSRDSQRSRDTQPPPQQSRPPRGRNFDATVLRKYSDDESPRSSSMSRSSSYNSTKSFNNDIGSASSSTSRALGGHVGTSMSRTYSSEQDTRSSKAAGSKELSHAASKNDRSDTEGKDQQRQLESMNKETTSSSNPGAEPLSLEKLKLAEREEEADPAHETLVEEAGSNAQNERPSEAGSESDEPEEWELALDDSDDENIPKSEPGPKPAKKPHPAEILNSSPSAKPSKIGDWSDFADQSSSDENYILDVYDFSPTIKTFHLTEMFAAYEDRAGGFKIKWLDSTRALVIFESAAVAKQAHIANLTNQMAKIRPYTGADKDTLRSANRPSASNEAYGVRPAKTDSVARRLVQGALGLRVRRTPEQIAEEKALVKAAKDARDAQRQEQRRERQEMDSVFDL